MTDHIVGIGYTRVSTAEQATGLSLAGQEERIRAWSIFHETPIIGIFSDPGVSGVRIERPGLRAALEALGSDTALVVYSLSRLSRSTRHIMDLIDEVKKKGAAIVSLTESIDSQTATGQMVIRLLANLSQWERDLIVERTLEALDVRRRAGKRIGSVPIGSWADSAGVLHPHGVEEAAIKIAIDLRAKGLSLRAIGGTLKRAGIKPRGKEWHPQTIKRMVSICHD